MTDTPVVEVFHPFRAQERHQLSLVPGEKLTIIEKDPSGWWIGRNTKGAVGIFPSTYTRVIHAGPPPAEVAREIVAARLVSELRLISSTTPDGANGQQQQHGYGEFCEFDPEEERRIALHQVRGMSAAEVSEALKEAEKERDELQNEVGASLKRIVEKTMELKQAGGVSSGSGGGLSTSTGSSAAAASSPAAGTRGVDGGGEDGKPSGIIDIATERQKLTIVQRRLDELEDTEAQLQQEFEAMMDLFRERGVETPSCLSTGDHLTSNTSGGVEELGSPLGLVPVRGPSLRDESENFALSPASGAPPSSLSSPAATTSSSSTTLAFSGEDGWMKGIQDAAVAGYAKHTQQILLIRNDELDAMEARLEELAAQHHELEARVSNKTTLLSSSEKARSSRTAELNEKLVAKYVSKAEDVKVAYEMTKKKAIEENDVATVLTEDVQSLEDQVNRGKSEYVVLTRTAEELQSRLSATGDAQERLEKIQRSESEAAELEDKIELLLMKMQEQKEARENELRVLSGKYKSLEQTRRESYNQIQELKGNLRVYCRIKPNPPKKEVSSTAGKDNDDDEYLSVKDDMTVEIHDPETLRDTQHEFDLVLRPEAKQVQIFEEVKPLATSVLDGYNVCIFAYGQTGSGKTYTMEGPTRDRGVNYRTVQELFRVSAEERGEEYSCRMSVSVIEVYNDKAFDLQQRRQQCRIRWGGEQAGVVVDPLVRTEVRSADEVQQVLERAYDNRSVAGTDLNTHSSRSHCILTVYVSAMNSATKTETRAKLHLIDLAGSERVKASGVEGDRLKEATHINTSLTHLKTVIQHLASNSNFVAFRNSTLTLLLQDSLGGNCKCLMFANVSAEPQNVPETICTMKYAAEARKVAVGKASANVVKKGPANVPKK